MDNIEQKFIERCKKIDIDITKEQLNLFKEYKDLLLEWNQKINLTSITEENEIMLKHYIDSLECIKYVKESSSLIDVGTGAGFPGIPIKIINNNIKLTLLDSLNKRINYLSEVINNLNLSEVNCIHGRAEEVGINPEYREKFDIATARAVANLNVLVEYCLSFVKIGGIFICMKGPECKDEIENSQKAIKILGGEIEKIDEFRLPDSNIERTLIIIRKIKEMPKQYPRNAGKPAKEPIV